MPQSISSVFTHIVFSTKDREPVIVDEVAPHLHGYMIELSQQFVCPTLQVGGLYDHIHILCLLSRKVAIMDLVDEVKKSPANG
jgi:REP element-mobilizing transposase RayT